MSPVTVIEAFNVRPAADRQDAACYRALRQDVDPRYVSVAEVESADAAPSPASLYEVVREHRTPDVEGGVVLVERFEVPEKREDARFIEGWDGLRAVLEQQRGYLGARLYRSVGAADLRFVEIARWSSPLMYARLLRRPGLQALPFDSQPALYQLVT